MTSAAPVRQLPIIVAPRKRQFHWVYAFPCLTAVWLGMFFAAESNPLAALQQNWPLIVVGLFGSVIANISALGGGIVAIPAMIFWLGYPPMVALKTAIGAQSIGLSIGSVSWMRNGYIPQKAIRYAIPGLLVGSTISADIIHANALLIKAIFGPVSIILGCLALATLKRGSHGGTDDIPDQARWPLFAVSVLGGLITGWIAVGEGEVVAAALMICYGVSAKRSIALGVILLAINSIYLMLNHVVFLGGIPWHLVLFNMGGAMYGAWLAPFLSRHIKLNVMKAIFASIAILDGSLFMFQCLRASHH